MVPIGIFRCMVFGALALALALTLANAAFAPLPAQAAPGQTAEDTVAAAHNAAAPTRIVELPKPLSAADAALYKRIFAFQAQGQWQQADRLLGQVSNSLLKPNVLAHRYLHAWYVSRFAELKTWLERYPDHPDSESIHKLAQKKGSGPLPDPIKGYLSGSRNAIVADDGANWESFKSAGSDKRAAPLKRKLRGLAHARQFARAEALINDAQARKIGDDADIDEMKTLLAITAYTDGNDALALRMAQPAALRSGHLLPPAHWVTGLGLWRSGRPEEARRHFEQLANTADASPWMISSGAFWAARANLISRRPQVVNHWLEIAASYPRTFYGLLATRALGQDAWFSWEIPPFTELDAKAIARKSGGRRALALMQLGDRGRAEEELRKLYPRAGEALSQSILALAHQSGMPELTLKLGGLVAAADGRFHDAAAFPMPAWEPAGGWKIDKALIYAIVRQESRFSPSARSPAGATGLMQLMPATARFLGSDGKDLTDPAVNLALGQSYLVHLMRTEAVGNNLFLLIAAYNAGPGNLAKWQNSMKYHDDALLFIESLPSRETRMFVERVMTNFWIYRHRMDQSSLSLDSVVTGGWPYYDGMDEPLSKATLNDVSN